MSRRMSRFLIQVCLDISLLTQVCLGVYLLLAQVCLSIWRRQHRGTGRGNADTLVSLWRDQTSFRCISDELVVEELSKLNGSKTICGIRHCFFSYLHSRTCRVVTADNLWNG